MNELNLNIEHWSWFTAHEATMHANESESHDLDTLLTNLDHEDYDHE